MKRVLHANAYKGAFIDTDTLCLLRTERSRNTKIYNQAQVTQSELAK
jgi:hypothetical protein